MELATGRRGSPHITSQQDRQKHQGIFGDGAYILNTGNMLTPEVQSSNKIHIKDGALMFQGALFTVKVGTYDEVTINNGNQGMKRKDLIVARYTYDSSDNIETGEWAVIQGTPVADNPVVPEATSGDIQAGDNVVECPVFVVNLDGINVTGIDIIPEVMDTIPDLISKLEWTMIREVSGGAFGTETFDISKYREFMLTIGPFAQGNVQENSRVLASTLIPKTMLEATVGKTDDDGVFQVVYQGASSRMFGGMNYSAKNTVQLHANNQSTKVTLWAR